MKRALSLTLLCLSAGCVSSEPPKAKPQLVTRSLFLDEPFALTGSRGASCRVLHAQSSLRESSALPHAQARVRPDVRTLELSLRCQDARGGELPSKEVLPNDSVVSLVLPGGATLGLSPEASAGESDLLVFELPDGQEPGLPAPRRFDVESGEPVVPREHAVGSLKLRTSTLALEVGLRQRHQDAALDALLDALAPALASDASLSRFARDAEADAALAQLSTIYREVRARFRPARLELSQLSASAPDAIALTLSLTRPRRHALAFEVARFELVLAHGDDGGLRVARFDNRDAARAALACEAQKEELARALRESQPPKSGATCNALGTLLPFACSEAEPALLARAIAVGTRCAAPFAASGKDRRALPGDFQLTLRRGRAQAGLDKNPRYVLSLFHGGQVVFHGKHWVESQERSDGRTDVALVAGLHEHVRALDFFNRRGGTYDQERCVPSDQGDVISVIAGARQRMVLNRDGCRGPFSESELTELRRHAEQVAGISAWTVKGASLADQEAEQWAIAE